LARLLASTRIREQPDAQGLLYVSGELVIGLEQSVGWEAAVLDQYQAMVKTICRKLSLEPAARASDVIGGSTYTFVVWQGHPLEQEVLGQLRALRTAQSELRRRVDAHNQAHGIPAHFARVISYAGQCVIEDEAETQGASE